jgi:hypothetical protein
MRDNGPDPQAFDVDAAIRKATLSKLRHDIASLTHQSEPETISKIVDQIAAAQLDEVQIDRLLQTLKNQSGIALDTLRKQLKTAQHRRRAQASGHASLAQRIAELNAQFAVVMDGGKLWVVRWRHDPMLDRQALERMTFQDFRNLYLNEPVNDTTIGAIWLEHPERQQYPDGIVFDPTNKAPPSYFNLWRGFAVTPKAGDWSLLREHMRQIVCNGDDANFTYLLDWCARLVQHPELPGEVAVVMRGAKGAGKGILGRWIKNAFGQHGVQIQQPEHLVGRYNAHLRDCILLFADEAFFAGDRKHEGVLKGLITEPTLMIEAKFVDAVPVLNLIHLIMASNDDWVVPASSDERRYFVLNTSDAKRGDHAYFAAIEAQMQNGGLAAMLHELLNRDISNFNVNGVPRTRGLKEQKALSLDSIPRWWLAVLDRGYLYESRHGAPFLAQWQDFHTNGLLGESYLQWCKKTGERYPKNIVQIGHFMGERGIKAQPYRPAAGTGYPIRELERYDPELIKSGRSLDDAALEWRDNRPPGWIVGDLASARRAFLEKFDFEMPTWDEEPAQM